MVKKWDPSWVPASESAPVYELSKAWSKERNRHKRSGQQEETSALFTRDYFFLDTLVWTKAENTNTSVQLSTSWPGFLFPPDCIGNYSTCCALAMGLAGRAVGTLGVLRGAPLPFPWRLALLFLSIWELDAQTAVETKPLYIWQTVPEVNVSLAPDWGLEELCVLAVFWLRFPRSGLRQLGLLACPRTYLYCLGVWSTEAH
ncbi:hypothetical protein PAMP_007659 [Pampus punctatissimus]